MEKKAPASVFKTAMNFGAILGFALIIVSVLFYLVGYTGKNGQWAQYAILLGIIIWGTKSHRDNELGGYISYGTALGVGTLIGFFSGIILAFYTYLFVTFVDSSLVQIILDQAEQGMIDGGSSEAEIEMGMKYVKMFTTPFWLTVTVIFTFAFISFLFSLITSAFLKKNDNSFEGNFK